MHATKITIQLKAISHNLAEIRRLQPQSKIVCMIKANAYGHGLIPVAKALSDADALGVATLTEALQLRHAGIDKSIVVMRGFLNAEELDIFLRDDKLIACVHTLSQIDCIELHAQHNHALSVWLKVDTGMHRLGISPEDFRDAYARLSRLACIKKPLVICSHLADAANVDDTFTQKQIACFDKLTASLPVQKSLLNSAGILSQKKSTYDWIRPGLILYGALPFSDTRQKVFSQFQSAMTFTSRVIAVKTVNAGETIGYTCAFTASRKMTIAVAGLGYGDGYPRSASSGTPVLIHGQRAPLVGHVSMDMIAVDVSAISSVEIGDEVILWGEQLPVAEIADYSRTISYELLCQLISRGRTHVDYA